MAGQDAVKVINNLSTNDILKLPVDGHQETFITDARGWVVAHSVALKLPERVWLWGSHASSQQICDHIDRYIIREDAAIHDRTSTHALFVAGDGGAVQPPSDLESKRFNPASTAVKIDSEGPCLMACTVPIFDPDSIVCCCLRERLEEAEFQFISAGSQLCSEQLFQWLRISGFWPLHPFDIAEKTIPQELDRDTRAISFVKGCYLGQETIARLDARGQLQKKLCLLEILSSDPQQKFIAGDRLTIGEKEAGLITSISIHPNTGVWRALALLRRGNFAPETELRCNGQPARVLPALG